MTRPALICSPSACSCMRKPPGCCAAFLKSRQATAVFSVEANIRAAHVKRQGIGRGAAGAKKPPGYCAAFLKVGKQQRLSQTCRSGSSSHGTGGSAENARRMPAYQTRWIAENDLAPT